CHVRYPILDGVPVLLPGGVTPEFVHESQLLVRDMYVPWIDRLVLQSLLPNHISLNLGSGNMRLDLPNVIRMDIVRTPYVDVVGDAHALPFLPGSFDYVFSLAVVEHLYQPFQAVAEMYTVLREGGYVFGECNFVFPYHGYPHHYFNASMQGMQQLFKSFRCLRVGVSPHQMPSFTIRAILSAYLQGISEVKDAEIVTLRNRLQQVMDAPLRNYDAYFTEETAHRVAAGVYFFGVKSAQGESQVLPDILQTLLASSPALQQRFLDPLDLGHADNLLLWAKGEGREEFHELGAYLQSVQPFAKNDRVDEVSIRKLAAEPIVEPLFANIPETVTKPTPAIMDGAKLLSKSGKKELVRLLRRTGESIRHKGVKGLLAEIRAYIKWRSAGH
ncbi:MAG: methyltransferase domain-containing protein, partial [Anaerolineae bacterium]